MNHKPKIQYVGQFYVHGSEAQALAAAQEQKKAKTRLPLAQLEKIEKVYVDPVALVGIVVAVVMLVTMVLGAIEIKTCWGEYEAMSEKLSELKRNNAQLQHEYRTSPEYDLEDIAIKAQAIGMIPMEEAQSITIHVTMPEPEPQTTLWDDIVWFVEGLFE